MIVKAIKLLNQNKDLEPETCTEVARQMMEGTTTDAQVANFLTVMSKKGETSGEIAAFAGVMREYSVKIYPEINRPLLDTCGTGGTGLNTFNISTAAAFVVAGAGLPVAKHGNRSLSSMCGSADILEALGVRVELSPGTVQQIIGKVGIGFMYAPLFHPAMKHVQMVRRKLGTKTIFNILGPLTNPANAEIQVIGVYSSDLLPKVADALKELGSKNAMIVNGSGMDEISSVGETSVYELEDGQISEYTLRPDDFGIKTHSLEELISSDLETSVRYFIETLEGKPGPRLETVLMNAAAAIKIGGLAGDFLEAMEIAQESIQSGKAMRKLDELIRESEKYEA